MKTFKAHILEGLPPEFDYKSEATKYAKKNGGKVEEFRVFNRRAGRSVIKYKVVK